MTNRLSEKGKLQIKSRIKKMLRGAVAQSLWKNYIFPLGIWFFDSRNGFYSLVKGLKMPFSCIFCHCPSEHMLSISHFPFSLSLFVTHFFGKKNHGILFVEISFTLYKFIIQSQIDPQIADLKTLFIYIWDDQWSY